MVSVEDRPTNLGSVVVLPLPILRSDLIHGPGEGLRFGKPSVLSRQKPVEPLWFPQINSLRPDSHGEAESTHHCI